MSKTNDFLTDAETRAVAWAKAGYCHWRKHFSGTRAEHNARKPSDWSVEAWDRLYLSPFGNEEFNWNVRAVRRLLADKRI